MSRKDHLWWPVYLECRNNGGEMSVSSGDPVHCTIHPGDELMQTDKSLFRTRFFGSEERAKQVIDIIKKTKICIERVRPSATQGEVKVFVNDHYITNFGDKIELCTDDKHEASRIARYGWYGENIGGWMSVTPDSNFVLGVVWRLEDNIYHFSDMVMNKLGISENEWVEKID